MTMREPPAWNVGNPHRLPECTLARKGGYEGAPELAITKRDDGLYDFVVYCGANNSTVYALTATQVRRAAERILSLVSRAGSAR